MHSVLVLGAGMVGSAMALDLAPFFDVTSADISAGALERLRARDARIRIQTADLRDETALRALIRAHDFVLSAVPGSFGYRTLEIILSEGKNCVDISFFPENALDLDALAKENGVTAVVDCGVAPGMDNLFLGYYNKRMQIQSFECIVGGLPKVRKWPFQYKAPFSPSDVLEEYTRPARYVEGGRIVVREALSDPEYVHFGQAGTLESFNTDGLRSLLFTMPHIPDMKEKTLRFPGHIEYVRVLRETGFLSQEPVDVGGTMVRPLDLTSKLLFNDWKLGDTEPEFTVMRVTIRGTEDGKPRTVVAELYDEYDAATQTSSMARTTGYTATAAVSAFSKGMISATGVLPPELLGHDTMLFRYLISYLEARGVHYRVTES